MREKPKKGQVNPKIDNFIFKHKQNLKKGQPFFFGKKKDNFIVYILWVYYIGFFLFFLFKSFMIVMVI